MFWTNFKRVVRTGAANMMRNGVVTFSAILIMTVTLFLIGSLVFLSGLMSQTLTQIKDKVDVNVYFVTDANEQDILALKSRIEALSEVSFVKYVSRDEALASFRERHKSDQLILQALDELDDNPLGASLEIKAKEPSQYESIAKFLANPALNASGENIIDKVNYAQNKEVINRLTKIINTSERLGVLVILLFILASILIAFNTIRLVIYTSKEEIGVMRLIGASNMYARAPFIVAGILYGLIASIVTLLLLYPMIFYVSNYTSGWFGDINIFAYYMDNFVKILLIIVFSGIFLGAVSSWLAVQKYLKV